jgi:hypothetical protein
MLKLWRGATVAEAWSIPSQRLDRLLLIDDRDLLVGISRPFPDVKGSAPVVSVWTATSGKRVSAFPAELAGEVLAAEVLKGTTTLIALTPFQIDSVELLSGHQTRQSIRPCRAGSVAQSGFVAFASWAGQFQSCSIPVREDRASPLSVPPTSPMSALEVPIRAGRHVQEVRLAPTGSPLAVLLDDGSVDVYDIP